jgi:trimethylamine:corrinoid methyltransferase-like protein
MNGAHYDQILIDNELIGMLKRMVDIIGHERSARWYEEVFEDIQKSLASHMYFLDSNMTLKEFRSNLWESNLLIRKNFDNWKDGGMRSILDNSVRITGEILKNYQCEPLDVSINREIEGIVKQALKRQH